MQMGTVNSTGFHLRMFIFEEKKICKPTFCLLPSGTYNRAII